MVIYKCVIIDELNACSREVKMRELEASGRKFLTPSAEYFSSNI